MSLSLLLIPFFIFLIAFALFALSAIFHIVKFELLNIVTIFVTIVFGVGTFFIATISASYISSINWKQEISLSILDGISNQQIHEQNEDNVLSF